MSNASRQSPIGHSHVFLGEAHEASERRTWAVILLCGAMMIAEIAGGLMFGSIALVADGLHMSTHAGALLLAALAYTYSRRHAEDPRFSFGTGKFGDLAGFTSAIVLSMISLLIGYEAVSRILHPIAIHFDEAIPIAVVGLGVNVASAWLLSSGGHQHGHDHGRRHEHDHDAHDHVDEGHRLQTTFGPAVLTIFEGRGLPRFRILWEGDSRPDAHAVMVRTRRSDGLIQEFSFADRGAHFESLDEIPEPHAFTAQLNIAGAEGHTADFEEHGHAAHDRDNNMRAALIHVMADAAVSVLVIAGLLLARLFGWMWMDPIAGMIGACVIASWSYGLIRDTGAILLDMIPDRRLAAQIRQDIESCGDQVADLHLWRLGPGHLGAIVGVATGGSKDAAYYRKKLSRFPTLSHLTIEVVKSSA